MATQFRMRLRRGKTERLAQKAGVRNSFNRDVHQRAQPTPMRMIHNPGIRPPPDEVNNRERLQQMPTTKREKEGDPMRCCSSIVRGAEHS